MRVIWKFPLVFVYEQEILLPISCEPLHVDVQRGTLCLWAMVDREQAENLVNKPKLRKLYIVGTGHEVPKNADRHLGTVLLRDFVWHIFMETVS